ncbi:MAG: metallophosphoesterase family protein [Gemmatimonadota bacterium]
MEERERPDVARSADGLPDNVVPPGVHHDLAPEHPQDASQGSRAPAGPPALPPVVEVQRFDWERVQAAVDPEGVRRRMPQTIERMDALLAQEGGPGFLFDRDRGNPDDRAIQVAEIDEATPLWFIGDLHGDLLGLEAALAVARPSDAVSRSRLVFLGDLFDDGGYGLETVLRVFELLLDDPASVTIIAGNHDEALGFDGTKFTATVAPSDFSDALNATAPDDLARRVGLLAVQLFARAPRALFFPDGLLVAHGGFPLVDLHAGLLEHGDWNDRRCLTDFVWTRAHPKARRKLPNRSSRGSQFGYEDFADFCAVATALRRPVTHMVRGHDHVDERWAVPPAYAAHPILTTVALSRQLAREPFGPFERVPTIARHVVHGLPQVHRLHIPPDMVRACYPDALATMTDDPGPVE